MHSMQKKAGIHRILAIVLAVILALGIPLTAFADTTKGKDYGRIGASGIPYGTVYIAGTSPDTEWTINETDPHHVVLSGKVPAAVGQFPLGMNLCYSFYGATNIRVTDGDGEDMPSPSHYADGNGLGYPISFGSWDDVFEMTVESDNKTTVTYRLHIEEDEAREDAYLLESLALVIDGERHEASSIGAVTGGITNYSLLPLLAAGDIQIDIDEELLISKLLDATVEFAFPEGVTDGGLATQDGRAIKNGDKLFESSYEIRQAMSYSGCDLIAGPVEQLNPDRTRYSLSIAGGTDDITPIGYRAFPAVTDASSNGNGWVEGDAFYFSMYNYSSETEYTLLPPSSGLKGAKHSLVSLYEGKEKSGKNLVEDMERYAYNTTLKTGDWYTVTMLYMGEEITRTVPVQISNSTGGGSSNSYVYFSLFGSYSYLEPSSYEDNSEYILWLDDAADLSRAVVNFDVSLFEDGNYIPYDPADPSVKVTANGKEVVSGVTEVDFTAPVTFRTTWNGLSDEKTFVSSQVVKGEGRLYVTAQNGQTVLFYNDDDNDFYGDSDNNQFYLYNIGTERLNNLQVSLKSGAAMEIDSYWTVGGETVFTPNYLAGIDLSAGYYNGYDYQWNRAMVRVVPKPGTKRGAYRDELIFKVDGKVVETLSVDADVVDDIPGENGGNNGGGNGNGGGALPGGSGGGTTYGGGRGRSSGGGTSSADSSSAAARATTQGVYWIESAEAKALAAKAMESGQNYVRMQRTGSTGLRRSAIAAFSGLRLEVDSVQNRAVQVRIALDPSQETADTLLSAWTSGSRVNQAKSIFQQWFANHIAIISMEQQGSFRQAVAVAARVDLSGLDTSSLLFYSYDRATHSYQRIASPGYTIDSNGYLCFSTQLAGDIIITDSPLTAK